jgi:hypothetical protein
VLFPQLKEYPFDVGNIVGVKAGVGAGVNGGKSPYRKPKDVASPAEILNQLPVPTT